MDFSNWEEECFSNFSPNLKIYLEIFKKVWYNGKIISTVEKPQSVERGKLCAPTRKSKAGSGCAFFKIQR
jgi:hypothetical protein